MTNLTGISEIQLIVILKKKLKPRISLKAFELIGKMPLKQAEMAIEHFATKMHNRFPVFVIYEDFLIENIDEKGIEDIAQFNNNIIA